MSQNIATVRLIGCIARGGKDFDQGILVEHDTRGIWLQDNDYGLNKRFYPFHLIERIDYRDTWQ